MSERFLKFSGVYSEFTRRFLTGRPDLSTLSYEQLKGEFDKTFYGALVLPAREMETYGYEVRDYFLTVRQLQQSWAIEHGVTFDEKGWLKKIALAQAREFQPDVIFLQDLYVCDREFRDELRRICGKRVTIIGWRGAPTVDFSAFSDLDLVLTCVPNLAAKMRDGGANSEVLPLSFEPAVLPMIATEGDRHLPITFAGSIGSPYGIWNEREILIEIMMEQTPMELWANFVDPISRFEKLSYHGNRLLNLFGVPARLRSKIPILKLGAYGMRDPDQVPLRDRFPDRTHPAVFGLEYYQLMADSKIALNNHGDLAESYAGNIRLYEATGMGACLLTDSKKNLAELFEPEVEVVTYRSAEECLEKALYLLEHDAERRAIGAAGQRRTLRDHTSANRAARLHELIVELRRQNGD